MSGFEPLLDESTFAKAPRDDSGLGGQSNFYRRSPVISPDLAAANRTQDDGGGAVDYDLGRALYSTPRLESVSKKAWQSEREPDHLMGSDQDSDVASTKQNVGFLSAYSREAREAIDAGRETGESAEAYREKFADIRRRRFGGFLNYNNWGWVRRKREARLRREISARFGPPRAAASAQMPEPAAEQAPLAPAPDHRIALPGKSVLKQGFSRVHDDSTLMPELANAQAARATAFEDEASAAAPFASQGALSDRFDVSMRGAQNPKPAVIMKRQDLDIKKMLFGAPEAITSGPSAAEATALKKYGHSMKSTHAAEKDVRSLTSIQHQADIGDIAMPRMEPGARVFNTSLFNGYWGAEMTNPKPTRQAVSNKRVGFDETADQIPYEDRDPERTFAKHSRENAAHAAPRKLAHRENFSRFRESNADAWSKVGAMGRFMHEQEGAPDPRSVPRPDSGAPLIEEE